MAKQREDPRVHADSHTPRIDQPGTDPKTATFASEPIEKIGTSIGPYKLLDQLGVGGMGTVYVADQERPVRRRVAVKVIKPGLDTDQVIARFEAERQALALMDHSNIARVLDAGTTGSGRPYFVMELVQGAPITSYCDSKRLDIRERLELFLPVCRAVQHAHQKGIIHRDLKPSNILVAVRDDQPVPKIIDFGIAKATTQRLTERTLYTQYGQLVGTPDYMSPEQAGMGGLDVDTRSDVYSLGAVLYELLCGDTPLGRHQLTRLDFVAMLNVIYEQEPASPSRRLADSGEKIGDIARRRNADPHKLVQTVKGELDWISNKALEKDRTRRYESASALAADIERYLNNEAVEASPPSATYRVQKFIRRNQAALIAAGGIALVLIAATIISAWQAYRATVAQQEMSVERQAAIVAKGDAERLLQQVQTSEKLAEARRLDAETAQKLAEQRGKQLATALAQANEATVKERNLRDEIERRLRVADAMRLAMQSRDTRERYPQRSLLLAAEAVEATRRKGEPIIPAAHQALRDAMESIGGRPLDGHESYVAFMEATPDGRWLFTSDGNVVLRWDLAADDPAKTSIRVGPPGFNHGARALSRDGRWLATIRRVANADRVLVWDLWQENLQTPAREVVVPSRQNYTNQVVFSPDATRLAASAWQTAWVWDLREKSNDPSPIELKANNIQFQRIAVSANGKWAVTRGGSSTSNSLWNLAVDDRAPAPQSLGGERDYIQNIEQSADGRWLAAKRQTGAKEELIVWDLNAENPLLSPREIPRPSDRSFGNVAQFRFTPDGRYLATAWQAEVALWDLAAEKWDSPSVALAVSEAAPAANGSAERTSDGVTFATTTFAQSIASMDVDRSGRFLVAADTSGTIVRWDLQAADPKTSRVVIGRDPGSWQLELSISPSGRWLVTNRYEDSPRVWDLTRPNPTSAAIRLHAHDSGRADFAIGGGAGSPSAAEINIPFLGIGRRDEASMRKGERWIVTRGNDSKPRLWDLWAPDPVRTGLLAGMRSVKANELAIRDDGSWVISNRNKVQIVDPDAFEMVSKTLGIQDEWSGSRWSSNDRLLSGDGRWLARNHGQRVSILDLSNEQATSSPASNILVRLGIAKAAKPSFPLKVINAEDLHFGSVIINADGRWLLTRAGDGWTLWSLKDDALDVAVVKLGHTSFLPKFSPDGQWLAAYRVADDKPSLSLWNLAASSPHESKLELPDAYLGNNDESIAFSEDGKWLATAGRVRLWRIGEEGPIGEPIALAVQDQFQSVAIGRDGRWVAASANQTVHLWDRDTKDSAPQVHVLRGHEDMINRMAFSADGAWLASATQSGDVRLWNLLADQIQDTMIVLSGRDRPQSQLQGLLFSPDSRWLAGKNYDTVVFWQLDPASLVENARQLAARELTSEEIERYRLNTQDIQRDRLRRQVAEISKRMEQAPEDATLVARRLDLHAWAGDFDGAIEDLRLWIKLDPENHWPYYCLLTFLAQTNQPEEYRRIGQTMAERFANPPPENREILERVAKGNLFWGKSGQDWDEIAALADRALAKAAENDHWVMPWAHVAKGLAEYRRGNYADALEWTEMALQSSSATVHSVAVPGNFVKACAHAQLNQIEEAQQALAAAKQAQAKEVPPSKNGSQWNDWYMSEVMLREAEATLLAKSPPKPATLDAGDTTNSDQSAAQQ